jgi:threonine dehydrogenase-like Zn-dependent dehydrogenase
MAMNKNLTINMGNYNHRKYVPQHVELVRAGAVRLSEVLSQVRDLTGAIDAYEAFDQRREGWHKVALDRRACPRSRSGRPCGGTYTGAARRLRPWR